MLEQSLELIMHSFVSALSASKELENKRRFSRSAGSLRLFFGCSRTAALMAWTSQGRLEWDPALAGMRICPASEVPDEIACNGKLG
jgi:hypothetical protein